MKKHAIKYTETLQSSPMTKWVHVRSSDPEWADVFHYDPPLPKPVPGKGYAYYVVEIDGFTFGFASLAEIDECIKVLSQKHLPSLHHEMEQQKDGPNSHWLNRLPANVKVWKYREAAVKYLKSAREAFVKEIGK